MSHLAALFISSAVAGDAGLAFQAAFSSHRTSWLRPIIYIREFQNDALIALTARRHGATVVTADREDFVLLSQTTGVRVLYPK